MYTLQSVLKFFKNINPAMQTYLLCLLLARGRKNCAAMAESTGLSQKKLYEFLNNSKQNNESIEQILFDVAKETRDKGNLRALVLDPTAILKPYSKKIESACYEKAGSTKRVERCLVPVYMVVVDKRITIPLSCEFWVQEKITGKRKYKSKIEITKELILLAIKKGIEFDYVSLDGAFAVDEMFTFFRENNLKFIVRIPKNRRITTLDGTSMQLKHHPALKLKRNEREKLAVGKIREHEYFFTSEKRKTQDNSWEVVFLASNMELSAKEQISAYNLRWPVEKVIRTTKQKFGTMQSQVLKQEKQRAHILAGFLAYTLASLIKNDKKKKSVDEVVNALRKLNYTDLFAAMRNKERRHYNEHDDSDVKMIQNHLPILNDYRDLIGLMAN